MENVKKKIATLSLGAALAISPAIFPGMLSEYAGFCMTCEAASHVDASLRPVQLAVNTHLTVDSDAEGDLLRSSRTTVNLVGSGQSTEALQQALWQYSKEAVERRQHLREGMLVTAAADRAERKAYGSYSFVPHEALSDVFVRRADTLAVSLLEYGESYEGGAHGSYGVWGRSFDTQTGKELTLGDVFVDKKKLMAAIENRLQQDYPKASFMESGGTELVREMTEKMVGDGTISWTLDPCGVTFYFNPYLIGSYMEGIFAATILFDEQPELFKDKYRHAPASYCMEILPYQKMRTAFAKGRTGTICVSQSDSGILIKLDDKELNDYGEASGLRPVVVSLADGRRYLYVDALEAGDIWETTSVYDISGKVPVLVPKARHMTRRADIPENYASLTEDSDPDKVFYIMADPMHFQMSDLSAGGGGLLRECRVGKSGAPEVIAEKQP